jgi:hypothetical protein
MTTMNRGKRGARRGTPDREEGLAGSPNCDGGPLGNPDRSESALGNPHVGGDAVGNPHAGRLEDTEHSDACDWKRAHNELVRLARDHARLEWEVGRWLLRALRAATPLRLGYASMAEYAHRLFGFDGRFTSEKLRVAETLEELPELSRALREGELTWSAVRELTRVATPGTEGDWLAVARGRVSRDIERMVSGRRTGDRPDDPADKSIVKHILRFEVRAETLALVREAQAKLRREAGGRLDDDAALLLMARQVLGGPKDTGRASYQISITKCAQCRRAHVHASGELVEVGAEVLEMAECDAQNIGRIPAGAGAVTNGSVNAGTGTGTGTGRIDGETEAPTHDRGELFVSGRVSTGVRFRHADGTDYGGPVAPRAAESRTKVFQALRGLGFREKHVKLALEHVGARVGVRAEYEPLFREVLAVLTP